MILLRFLGVLAFAATLGFMVEGRPVGMIVGFLIGCLCMAFGWPEKEGS